MKILSLLRLMSLDAFWDYVTWSRYWYFCSDRCLWFDSHYPHMLLTCHLLHLQATVRQDHCNIWLVYCEWCCNFCVSWMHMLQHALNVHVLLCNVCLIVTPSSSRTSSRHWHHCVLENSVNMLAWGWNCRNPAEPVGMATNVAEFSWRWKKFQEPPTGVEQNCAGFP